MGKHEVERRGSEWEGAWINHMWSKVGPTGWILFILEVLQLIWIFVCRHSYIFKCIFGINKAEWNRNYASQLFIMENPQKTWIYSGTVAFKSIVCLCSRSLHGYFFTARAWTPALTHSLMSLTSEATVGNFLHVFLLWVSPCICCKVYLRAHPATVFLLFLTVNPFWSVVTLLC